MPQTKGLKLKPFCENFDSNPDLRLSGSQINLMVRPRSFVGKASARALTVGGIPRARRPMSAVPLTDFPGGPRNKRRPYSADSQLLVSANRPLRRDKNPSCFPKQQEDCYLDHSESERDNYHLSSSTYLNSLLSDETETHGNPVSRPVDLDTNDSLTNTSDLLCTFSDISEEPTNSERSLGERICKMAQNTASKTDFSCSQSHFSSQEVEIKNKITITACTGREEDEAKRLSNRELHFRMIEAGLISPAGNKNGLSDSHEQVDSAKSDLGKDSGCPDVSVNSSGETEANEGNGKEDNVPEESSVLDGSKLGGKRTVTFGAENVEQKGEENEELSKRPGVPVRFQQWMTANNPASPGKTELTSLFCGTQLYPPRRKKSDLFLECMVEEILDEEQELLMGNQPVSSWTENNPGVPTLDKNVELPKQKMGKVTITTWPNSAENPVSEKIQPAALPDPRDETNERVIPIEITNEDKSPQQSPNNHPRSTEKRRVEEWSTGSFFDTNRIFENETLVSSSTVFNKTASKTSVSPEHKTPTKSSADGGGPTPAKAPGTIRTPTSAPSRRNCFVSSTKVSIATCRFGKGSKSRTSPSRRIGRAPNCSSEEDRLPGEYSTEVESWMAVKCGGGNIGKVRSEVTRAEDAETTKMAVEAPLERGRPGESTFDEIFDLLKVLEEDKPAGTSASQTPTNKDDGRSNMSPVLSTVTGTGLDTPVGMQNVLSPPAKSSVAPSVDHDMKNILNYLDQVDESCDSVLTTELSSACGTARNKICSRNPDTSDHPDQRIDELLVMSHVDLAREVLSIRLALEESTRTVELLRASLKEQRESHARREKAHKTAMDRKLHEVKSECEAIVKRHQKFIDQLIVDKTALNERCERLVSDARQNEERHSKTVSEIEERHRIEIQRTRDIATATEKLRHERWAEKKTQKIKELTVRGLEPELSRMSTQHEQELSSLRALHAQELEQAELRAARRCSQQLEALRTQMQKEQEEALTRERDQHRLRLDKIQQAEDDKIEEQRRLLVAEIRRERDRLAAHEVALEAQFEERKRLLERETEKERERLRREYIEKAEVLQNAHQSEMARLRETLEAEKEAWLTTSKQQQNQAMAQATAEVKEQLRRERDRELESVIERLEHEATKARIEKDQATENRIRRLRDQYNNELKEAEKELGSLQAKNADLRAALQEKEASLVALEVQNRSVQTELLETRKIAETLSAERADIKKNVQKEIDSDMEKLRTEIAELRSKHSKELMLLSEQMERERNVHQQELQNLYARVKQAIEKKDDVVQTAKAKHRAAEDHIRHLEAMLQQQRRINSQTLP